MALLPPLAWPVPVARLVVSALLLAGDVLESVVVDIASRVSFSYRAVFVMSYVTVLLMRRQSVDVDASAAQFLPPHLVESHEPSACSAAYKINPNDQRARHCDTDNEQR